jgi:alpha/beta superfamily hydrolase
MKPLYFGSSQRPLLGLHHPPRGRSVRPGGVVLCSHTGSEYVRAHRSLRELANRIAEAGVHALRFDYYGSGDSGGESDEGTAAEWMADIEAAIREMSEASGSTKVSLVGLRVGAALAALVGAQRAEVEKIVLWEPIVNGASYIRELLETHDLWCGDHLGERAPKAVRSTGLEAIGFPLTPALKASIETIDLLTLSKSPAREILVLTSEAGPEDPPLVRHLRTLTPAVEHRPLTGPKVWVRGDEVNVALVPHQLLQYIASWLSK